VLPGSEVFSALERKVVDAIEWGGPGINLSEGFHKVAPYIITPGLHAPGGAHDCIFNKDVWAKIGDRDKAMLELAGRITMLDSYLGYLKNDIKAYGEITQGYRI
jgi:TRAP-type mannitol/chloroaromatic compound transport system substrate-binding protein